MQETGTRVIAEMLQIVGHIRDGGKLMVFRTDGSSFKTVVVQYRIEAGSPNQQVECGNCIWR